ncbi:MAG: VCBS repeat-containing protein [Planctomycetes bacterium]|nr:VCBS repeat-containing protein [Planctomycetota bacterium]
MFLNDGAAFSARLVGEFNGGSYDLALADVNDDARLDVVMITYENGIIVLFGEGNGNFSERAIILPASDFRALRIDDMNGDRRPDILASDNATRSIVLLTNSGEGKFQKWAEIHQVLSGVFANGDLDGDGNNDVASGEEGRIALYLSNGKGTFQKERILPLGSSIYDLEARDLDGDDDYQRDSLSFDG